MPARLTGAGPGTFTNHERAERAYRQAQGMGASWRPRAKRAAGMSALKSRLEADTAFADAGRVELATKERAEEDILARYLPAQLSDDELRQIVCDAIAASGASSIGPAMKAVQAAVAGRAEGGRVAAEVRRQLAT